ncbi:MAG: hypothetical protein M0Z76_02815 [Gammaproteobacteria bacterium]|nr:hypothetical protein [Gammaproteobacteria bacterium]
METLLSLSDRTVFLVTPGPPAVYFIADHKAGGILINAPAFSPGLQAELARHATVRYLFLPSHRGACDLAAWRERGVEVLAFEAEVASIDGPVDVAVDGRQKLTRTIDFLPMAGRTPGTCGLRIKNLPGVLFLGPALRPGADGWPQLLANDDDYSYESRLLGVFGLRDVRFDYLFTDSFVQGVTRFGPGADQYVRGHLDALLT